MSRRFAAVVAIAAVTLLCRAAPAEPPGPAEDYLLHCSGCHGSEGRGVAGAVPSLHDLGTLVQAPGGREYVVRVPGVAQAPLSDARLARLLDWLLERWSGSRPGYDADEVGRLRRKPLRDPVAARPRP